MITRTADRTLQIFEFFADRLEPTTLSDLARALEMPISSCAALIHTLQARGYLYEVSRKKAYYPTSRWLAKARDIANADPIATRLRPFLEHLSAEVGETVILSKRLGDQVIHLAIVEGTQNIRYSGQVGDFKSLLTTASGQAILARLSTTERLDAIIHAKNGKGDADTISQRNALLRAIEQGLRRGWWRSKRGASGSDVMSLGTSVVLGSEIYAVVIAGPVARIEPGLDRLGKKLIHVCEQITKEL